MTVMVAIPAMPMMRVSYRDHNLRARCRNQRREEQQSEKSKRESLHEYWDAAPFGWGCARFIKLP
jgi:hypothetical protein